jgi:hypothetical protein
MAADYFYNTILQKYPEFWLCDGNWKLQMWTTKHYSDWTKNVRGGGGISHMFLFYIYINLSVCLQGANPSIIQVGEKRRLNGTERDDKASKKARSVTVKKEIVKEEKPPPATPVICSEPITIDDESDSDILDYMSDSEPVCHVMKIYMYSY